MYLTLALEGTMELPALIEWGRRNIQLVLKNLQQSGGLVITSTLGNNSIATIAERVQAIDKLLNLGFVRGDEGEPTVCHLPDFIGAILEELKAGTTIESLGKLEKYLEIGDRSESSIDERLDEILETLREPSKTRQVIVDVCDLIGEILASGGDPIKKLEALRFKLLRIKDIEPLDDVYREVCSFVVSA